MCGIVGIAGTRDVAPVIVEALKRLEYRGYDSAGVATLVDGQIDRRRAPGKLTNLEAVLRQAPLPGRTGIGVRLEINVYTDPKTGPRVTSCIQDEPLLLG